MTRLPAALALVLGLAACADWPDLDVAGPGPGEAGYPALEPIDRLIAQAASGERRAGEPGPGEAVEARAAALRARAAVLGQPAEDAEALEEIRRRLAARAE